jgi:copper oxidase (laccase) domain-containing protein
MTFSENSGSADGGWIEVEGWRSKESSHGFCTRGLDDRNGNLPWSRIKTATGVHEVLFNEQTHSDICLDLRSEDVFGAAVAKMGPVRSEVVADAMVVPRIRRHGSSVLCGIITADCLPILFRTPQYWGLVHAGWRGLASGIIERALTILGEEKEIEAAIGPCAGSDDYEVGPEVIEAVGRTCCSQPGVGDRSLLDLAGTAAAQIQRFRPGLRVLVTGISTMKDERFFSYRRDGPGTGRNVSFCVVRGEERTKG